jgi:hypothetical protein
MSTATGCLGAGLIIVAILIHSFGLLCLGCVGLGIYHAGAQYYSFAATEGVTDKTRAVAHILAAGVIGAIVGPMLASWSQSLTVSIFIGPFLISTCMLGINACAFFLWHGVPAVVSEEITGRPLGQIVYERSFIQAATLSVCAYGIMSYIMTASPLAVVMCGLTSSNAASVIQWHLAAMYAPAYALKYTRLGDIPSAILTIGCVALAACVAVLLAGNTLAYFIAGLVLLGIGWNFVTTCATTMLVNGLPAEDQSRAQGANELMSWGANGVAAGLSGIVFGTAGWNLVLLSAMAPLILVIGVSATEIVKSPLRSVRQS